MQYSLATMLPIFLAALFSFTLALPTSLASRDSATPQQLADAQNDWRADTSVVSQFLSSVPTLTGSDLAAAAKAALDAENDELLHKKVLDQAFSADPRIAAANNVLVTQGTFQVVLDALQDFADNGATMTPAQIATLFVNANSVRCSKVLPAIDVYFSVTAEKLQNGGTLIATRPSNC